MIVAVFPVPTLASEYVPVTDEIVTVSEPTNPDNVPCVIVPQVFEPSYDLEAIVAGLIDNAFGETIFPVDEVVAFKLLAPALEITANTVLLYMPAFIVEEKLTYTVEPLATETEAP